MKIEKSNNPLGIVALVGVLLVICGRIVMMLTGHTEAASAANVQTVQTPVAAAITEKIEKPTVIVQTAPKPARNPFSRSAHRDAPAAQSGTGVPVSGDGNSSIKETATLPASVIPLPPLGIRPLSPAGSPGGAAGAENRLLPMPVNAGLLRPGGTRRGAAGSDAPTMKLTAIIDGTEPAAVIQTAQPEPVIVHVGSRVDGMRVTAIHAGEVIFERGSGVWTLAMQTSADPSPATVSVAPSETAQENTDVLP